MTTIRTRHRNQQQQQAETQMLTIGHVAKQTGVGVETLRFYEREELIAEPARSPSGYRQYTPDAVQRIRFIRKAKTLGFTLKEIKELLALQVNPNSTCGDVRKTALDKVADIEARIESLIEIKDALNRLAKKCSGKGATTECPILDELSQWSTPYA